MPSMQSRILPRYSIALVVLASTALFSILLALPGQTVSTKYVNDLLIFLDGGYRIVQGQVPNQDFHTALGPLSFYIPALGYWLSGTLGGAMPFGMVALMLAITPSMVHILQSRMRPLIAVPMAVFLLLLLAAPLNTGEMMTDLSFAMFYNRIGWAALGLLLVMHLQPTQIVRRQLLFDSLSAALLTLVLLFTKATYGLVALGFLGLMLLAPPQRRWAALSLLFVLAVCVLVEAFWRSTVAHLDDLFLAINVSGTRPLKGYLIVLLQLRGEYLLYGLVVGLALWRTRRVQDLLFYGFCAGAGLALFTQNYQVSGVVTLHAGAAVAAETLLRNGRSEAVQRRDMAAAAAPLLLIAFLLPIIATSASALALHTALAVTRQGDALNLPNASGLYLAELLSEQDYKKHSKYLASLDRGAELLKSLDPPPSNVFVMDFVSPFSSLLGIQPPQGDTAWAHSNRNFDDSNHLPAVEILDDVQVVMQPKRPIARSTTKLFEEIYGSYIQHHFEIVRETREWRIFRRKEFSAPPRRPQTVQAPPRFWPRLFDGSERKL